LQSACARLRAPSRERSSRSPQKSCAAWTTPVCYKYDVSYWPASEIYFVCRTDNLLINTQYISLFMSILISDAMELFISSTMYQDEDSLPIPLPLQIWALPVLGHGDCRIWAPRNTWAVSIRSFPSFWFQSCLLLSCLLCIRSLNFASLVSVLLLGS
jgi:hypothetical protein